MLTADWVPFDSETFFRKIALYTMNWSEMMDVSNYIIISASCGGPIAVIRDDKRILKYQISGLKPIIHIFNQSGKELSTITWNNGKIIFMGWTSLESENLVCVQEDGTLLIYDMLGNFKRSFNFSNILHTPNAKGSANSTAKIIDCCFTHYVRKESPNHGIKVKTRLGPSLKSAAALTTQTAMAVFVQISSNNYQSSSQTLQNKLYFTMNLEQENVRLEPFFESATNSPSLSQASMIPCSRHSSSSFIPDNDEIPLWHILLDGNNNPNLLIARENGFYMYNRLGHKEKVYISVSKEYKSFLACKLSVDQSKVFILTDTKVLWIGMISFNDEVNGLPTLIKIAECDLNNNSMEEFNLSDDSIQPLTKQYENISIGSNGNATPLQINWCGNYALVITNQRATHLNLLCWPPQMGDDKDMKACSVIPVSLESEHDISPPTYAIISELDGCRILTRYTNIFLQMVPSSVTQIFRIGSVCPAALVVDASQAMFEANDTKRADEYLSTLRCCSGQSLKTAFETCLDAALQEFDVPKQKMLLRALSFGRALLKDVFNSPCDAKIVDLTRIIQLIRVLNAIRHSDTVSVPLTFNQYMGSQTLPNHAKEGGDQWGLEIILTRLINRRQFALAVEISEYTGNSNKDAASTSRVLSNWACYKAGQLQLNDRELSTIISSKLGPSPGIRYSEIACHALEAGRPELAGHLLEYETNLKDRVNLLVRMGKISEALKQACMVSATSNRTDDIGTTRLKTSALIVPDPELIFLVFLRLVHSNRKEKMLDSLNVNDKTIEIIEEGPEAAKKLYPRFCHYFLSPNSGTPLKQNSNKKTITFSHEQILQNQLKYYTRLKNYQAMASTLLNKNTDGTSLSQKMEHYQVIAQCFQSSSQDFLTKQTVEHIKLLKYQNQFKGMGIICEKGSLYDTMSLLVKHKEYKICDDLKKEFKMSDKQYWWLKIGVLGEIKEWTELERFSNLKKSPIGYEPFVDVCLKNGANDQAMKYITRVENENKVQYYLKVGLVDKACEMAYQQKSIEKLEDISKIYANDDEKRKIKEKIQLYRMQLKK